MIKPIKYEEWQVRVIAMAIDTDGSIGLTKSKRKGTTNDFRIRPSIQFCGISKQLVEYIRELIGFGTNVHAYKSDNAGFKKNYKVYTYKTVGMLQHTLNLLQAIEPFLIIKQKKAQTIIEFCKSRLSKYVGAFYSHEEVEMWERCKALNDYGERLEK